MMMMTSSFSGWGRTLCGAAFMVAIAACSSVDGELASAARGGIDCVPKQESKCLCGLQEGTQTCSANGVLGRCKCGGGDETGGRERSEDSDLPAREGATRSTSTHAPEVCKHDDECGASRICKSGDCVKGCRDDAGCAAGLVCQAQQCVKSSTSGSGCKADVECDLGTICVGGSCAPGCYTEGDCPIGEECSSAGMCEPAPEPTTNQERIECVTDADCGTCGKVCGIDFYAPKGAPLRVCVSGCTNDLQCPGIEICDCGVCR